MGGLKVLSSFHGPTNCTVNILTYLLQTLSAKNAALLDKDLMSIGGFSLDQLMELAGLSVSQAG